MIEQRPITNREEWLGWRKLDVTASVIGALFDVHPYVTALRLYVEKRGVEFPTEETKTMRRGRWLEQAIGSAVAELRPDWKIEAPNVYLRDGTHRIGATPDFFLHGDPRGLGVLQAKSVAPSVYHGQWDHGAEPPLWITLQTLTEMMLAEAAFGAVACMLVDPHQMDVQIFEVPRNPAAEAKIVDAVHEFWKRVQNGIEPEPDYGRDADVIRALHPRETPGKSIDLAGNNLVPELLDIRSSLKDTIADADKRCKAIENEIKYLLKDAETVTGLQGWRISYKTEDVKGYDVKQRTQRPLRITDKREGKEATA
jgi:predicted phage-related endonuclease